MKKLLVLALVAACTNQPFTVDVPLRVVATSPSGGSTGAVRKIADGTPAPITATFSEDLDAATVTAKTVTLSKVGADGTLTAIETADPKYASDAGAFTVTVTPKARLEYSAQYRLQLATGIRATETRQPLSAAASSAASAASASAMRTWMARSRAIPASN